VPVVSATRLYDLYDLYDLYTDTAPLRLRLAAGVLLYSRARNSRPRDFGVRFFSTSHAGL
jgi:hypothetical protein